MDDVSARDKDAGGGEGSSGKVKRRQLMLMKGVCVHGGGASASLSWAVACVRLSTIHTATPYAKQGCRSSEWGYI